MTENIKNPNIVNLTPHTINVLGCEPIIPSGDVARVNANVELVGSIADIPIYTTTYGEINGLPDPKDDTYYIVSRIVKNACQNRTDVLVPGELIRSESGAVIGCRGFSL